jgi:hypothetical protein
VGGLIFFKIKLEYQPIFYYTTNKDKDNNTMGIKEIWASFSKDSSSEVHQSPILRKLGFAGVLVVDAVINANFYISIAESWIMPIAGLILVFMKVWNWVSAQSTEKIRQKLHYGAWFCLAVMSVIAAVSFGMAVTSATNSSIDQVIGLQNLKNTALTSQVTGWVKERAALTDTIIQLNTEIASLTGDRADWNHTKAADQASLKQANDRATELDNLIKGAGVDTSGKVVKQGALVNAQLVFSQVFSDKGAPLAIKIFFFIFGIAIELTLALSSLPNFKKILKPTEEPPEETLENNEEEKMYTLRDPNKPKRSYKRRQVVPKVPTLGTGVSDSNSFSDNDKETFTDTIPVRNIASTPDILPDAEASEKLESTIILNEEDAKKFLEALANPPEPNEALRDLLKPTEQDRNSIDRYVVSKALELIKEPIEDVPVRPIIRSEERFIKALYNNDGHPYLKDKTVAAKEAAVSIPEALKIFDFLSSVNGPTGTKYIEFRPTTSKWYPNYTSELIISLLHDDKITLL